MASHCTTRIAAGIQIKADRGEMVVAELLHTKHPKLTSIIIHALK